MSQAEFDLRHWDGVTRQSDLDEINAFENDQRADQAGGGITFAQPGRHVSGRTYPDDLRQRLDAAQRRAVAALSELEAARGEVRRYARELLGNAQPHTVAQFASDCGLCVIQIDEGDQIVKVGNGSWVHEGCASDE